MPNPESRGIPKKLRRKVLERDGYRCCVCRSKDNLRVAHRFPLSREGETVFWNLVTLCVKCWRAKGRKIPQEFIDSYYYQFTILKRGEPGKQTKRVTVVLDNGNMVNGQMVLDCKIEDDFWIKVESKGVTRLLPKSKIKHIDVLEDLTDNEAQVT